MSTFKREERYIVIKLNKLADSPYARGKIASRIKQEAGNALVDCVVVEHDWPEYETVWQMIQDRVEAGTKP